MSYLFLVAGTAPGATVLLQCCPHLTGLDGPFFMLLTSGALFSTEITGYVVVCIAMHMRKINQVRFWRVFGWFVACFTGFLPETP